MLPSTNYHECKLQVKAVVPGSLASFIYAYCRTINCPDSLEPHFIRKSISFAKLSKYVCKHITNDFDAWYRANEDSETLFNVLATIINTEENRTSIFNAPSTQKKLVSEPFTFKGSNLQYVLVAVSK